MTSDSSLPLYARSSFLNAASTHSMGLQTELQHLYVHVPFCARRCSYCDFSIAVRKQVPWREYAAGIARELKIRMQSTGTQNKLHQLQTLYLGGGTPSHLGASGISALLDALGEHFAWNNDVEFTLEANPEDISVENVRYWRNVGVNRLSVGIQSFHDNVLQWMHRVHDAETAKRAVNMARDGGIEEHSIDLIFATPDNVTRSWAADVDDALALGVNHISVYGLTIEQKTPLGRWRARGEVNEAEEGRFEEEYLLAHYTLTDQGYEHYEVSNYALPGNRARHNSAYWHNARWMGIGPAAHSFDGAVRRWNEPAYALWMRTLDEGNDPLDGSELLTKENQIAETVYLGMRTSDGLLVDEREVDHVRKWVEEGWVQVSRPAGLQVGCYLLKCTANGWLRLDSLAANLTAFRDNS